jgi:NADPH-dependent glutamate synthase beta subunit-like oxidoreductase
VTKSIKTMKLRGSVNVFSRLSPSVTSRGYHVAVIGAGVAGCNVAHQLERFGYQVTLIDRHKGCFGGCASLSMLKSNPHH